MEVVFSDPIYLWGLVAIPLIILVHFISLRYSRARAFQFANFIALSRVSKGVGLSSNVVVLILRILIITLIILAIAGMTLVYIGKSSSVDYVLGIDVSSSMLTEDLNPNRVEAVKAASVIFIDKLSEGSDVALLSFSGVSFVEKGLSSEKEELKEVIRFIAPKAVGGTDISNAIVTGVNVLIVSEKPKVLILLTDGRSNVGVPESIAINYANEKGVIVHTIGIGLRDIEGGNLGIDEEALKNIADSTGGKYAFAGSNEELVEIYSSLAETGEGKRVIDFSSVFIILVLVLLLVDWVLINTIYSRIP